MGFSSIPPYLDPSNWQQQPPPPVPPNHLHHQPGNTGATSSCHPQLPPAPPPPPPPPPPQPHGVGSIRPGSMADRARMANIPMPDGPLKCPRCDSTNTKFCYFNNYSLTQPRHFCKTCRRYWTRGGALRNVPVGGGCRRNKRSKGSSSSKSPASSSDRSASGGAASSGSLVSSGISSGDLGPGSDILGHIPSLRLMPPLHYLSDFGSGEIGMNYSGILPPSLGIGAGDLNFPASATGLGGGGASGSLLSVGGNMERLRLTQAQFPFLGGSDAYPFEGTMEPSGFIASQLRPKATPVSSTQPAAVKMEDSHNSNNNINNNQELNLSRQFPGMINPGGGDQFHWNTGSAWTDLSGFSSSSTTNPP